MGPSVRYSLARGWEVPGPWRRAKVAEELGRRGSGFSGSAPRGLCGRRGPRPLGGRRPCACSGGLSVSRVCQTGPPRGWPRGGRGRGSPPAHLLVLLGHEPQAVMSHEEEVGEEVDEGEEAVYPQQAAPARGEGRESCAGAHSPASPTSRPHCPQAPPIMSHP